MKPSLPFRRRRLLTLLPVTLACASLGAASGSLDEARQLHAAGRLDEALGLYRQVSQVADEDPATAAIALNNACVILMNTGDHRGAVDECTAALRLARRVDDPRRLARTLNNLGLASHHVGDYGAAAEHFRQALELNSGIGDTEGRVVNLANLGVTATQAGRYAEALDRQAAVVRLAEAHADAPWSAEQILLARINQAVVLERLAAYREALAVYRSVLDRSPSLAPGRRATLQVNIGVVYRNLGDPVRASEAFAQAIRTFERLGDRSGLANATLNLALVQHLNLGRHAEAESGYRRALALSREAGDHAEETQTLVYLGRLLLDLGRLDAARAAYDSCLDSSSDAVASRWQALDGLARVSVARGDHEAALAALTDAIDEIESVRESLVERPLRTRYFGDKRPVYAALVELLAARHLAEPGGGFDRRAFEIVQRAKVRSLIDALGVPAVALDTASIADHVGDDLLLEYFVGEGSLYVWAVHRGSVRMIDLGLAGPTLARTRTLYDALRDSRPLPPDLVRDVSHVLLGPVDELRGRFAELRVAADGELRYLPFEVLELPASPGTVLVRRAPVSYLPSASTLGGLGRRDRPAELFFAAIGAPELPRTDDAGPTPSSLVVSRFALGDLPAARAELEHVARLLRGPGETLEGSAATEPALTDLARRGARVLHVATHAVVDEREGRGAAILLTPTADADGLLRPSEIAGLHGRFDLTVLSACRSALGDGGSDALASLTGAWLAAGSSAVVATLWDVGDAASAAFMEQFYHELRRGRTPAQAIRRAKLRMLDDPGWAQPGLWAAYVLVGSSGPLEPRSRALPWAAAIAVSALLVLALLRWRARRRVGPPGLAR